MISYCIYVIVCSAQWGDQIVTSLWIVAIGAQLELNWEKVSAPGFETRLFVMPPDGITTQVWYLKGANGLTVTQQVTNVIMMA